MSNSKAIHVTCQRPAALAALLTASLLLRANVCFAGTEGKRLGIPFAFEENYGQAGRQARFLARRGSYDLLITADGFALNAGRSTVRMRVVGANPRAEVVGEAPLPGRSHYLLGRDRTCWLTDIPQHARVRVRRVRPGIDLVFRGAEGQLEYDLLLAPGANVAALRMVFEGQRSLKLDGADLVLETEAGEIRQRKPRVYQDSGAGRRELEARYVRGHAGEVRIALSRYDRTRPLVIDPVVVYATFLPGSQGAVAVDTSGNAYIAGSVPSSQPLPTTPGALRPAYNGGQTDAFVIKLDAAGSTILYATYLGGIDDDGAGAIAVDTIGNAYITGYTDTRDPTAPSDFPVTPGALNTHHPFATYADVFVSKLSPDGRSLVYSALIGHGAANRLAIDSGGNAYLAGSPFFANATPGAFSAAPRGGIDIGIAKLNPQGTDYVYVTYVGGSLDDYLGGICTDREGNLYIGGETWSPDFPTTSGSFRTYLAGRKDAFVTKLNPSGTALVYSTFLGGSADDNVTAVAVDASGSAHVTGTTSSSDFPVTEDAINLSQANPGSLFVTKMDAAGRDLAYSALLPGGVSGRSTAIAIDGAGRAVVAGTYPSSDFPFTPGALARVDYLGTTFLTVLGAAGDTVAYSTGLGHLSFYELYSMVLDSAGAAYLWGNTTGTRFSGTPGSVWPAPPSGSFGWLGLAKVDLASPVRCDISLSPPAQTMPSTGGPGSFQVMAPAGCLWEAAAADINTVRLDQPLRGMGPGIVNFTLFRAAVGQPRTVEIRVNEAVFRIDQAGGVCGETSAPDSVEIPAEGGWKKFRIVVMCNEPLTTDVPWLTAAATGDQETTLTAQPNPFAARTALLRAGNKTVRVTQAAGACTMSAGAAQLSFPAEGGTGAFPVTITGPCSWTARSIPPWIRLEKNSGGTGLISLTVASNPSLLPRAGAIWIDGQAFPVTQAASTAGLASQFLISTYLGYNCGNPPTFNVSAGQPTALAVDVAGNLFVGASLQGWIVRITPDGTRTVVAGGGTDTGENVPATSAAVNRVAGLLLDGAGNIYFSEAHRIRKIGVDGKVNTVAGGLSAGFGGDNGPALQAQFFDPGSLVLDGNGNLYVADSYNLRVRKIDRNGIVTTFAGNGQQGFSGDGGPATEAGVYPVSIALDAQSNLFISDPVAHRIRKVGPDGRITSVAGNGNAGYNGDGLPPLQAAINDPLGLALDLQHNPVFCDGFNGRVRRAAASLTTIAGAGLAGNTCSGDGGPATQASIGYPEVIASDGKGGFFIAARGNYEVRKLTPVTDFCTFTVSTSDPLPSVPRAGGIIEFTVTAVPGCAWTAVLGAPWLTVQSGANGVGNGEVRLSATENGGPGDRSGQVSIAGQTFVVTQTQNGSVPLRFVPTTPCRVADTRTSTGKAGFTGAREFPVAGLCGVPAEARAYSLNVSAVPRTSSLGFLAIWPAGQPQPVVSTLNSYDGRVKANAAIVPASAAGAVSVFTSDPTDVFLDISGYFVPAASAPDALAFYPLAPCRIMDTRSPTPLFGGRLAANRGRTVPVPLSACSVPDTARAYALNFTVIPRTAQFSFLTTWPSGQTMPVTSTLNAFTGAVTANAAIVPAGPDGFIVVYGTDEADVIVDVNGYFAPPGPGGLAFYTTAPCRAVDTREATGKVGFAGSRNYSMPATGCGLPAASAYALNATVVPRPRLDFLALWPSGGTQPGVSTLNSFDGTVVSNAALVPAATGSITAYHTQAADLILDVTGYFAP